MSPALRIGATGFGLIAVCYGFARFAFGLFLPQIDSDLGLGASLSGVISGGSFLGYCVAIIVSARLSERLGARYVAIGAAVVAATGMAGIAVAPSADWLAASVMLAGTSTGLASPPMAAAVAAAVPPWRQDATNTVINAGTAAGVTLSGPVALAMGGQWRLAFGVFTVLALAVAAAAAVSIPASAGGSRASGLPPLTGTISHLVASSFLMGAASTAVWSFGGQLVTLRLSWGNAGSGLLWTCIGASGMVGAWAGNLVSRFGMKRMHRVFLALMAASIVSVGSSLATPLLALSGGALFGAAYMMLTGVYLVWGVRALPDRPAIGLTVGFLTIAIGQTAGAPIFGLLLDRFGTGAAATSFAVIALMAGVFSSRVAPLPAGA